VIDRKLLQQVARASATVTEMAVTVVAGVFAGGWLDGRFGTGPVFLVLLSLGALVFGMWRLATSLNRLFDGDERLPPDPDA
jgi:ATP synthase protein I